jgi:transcriptional regulator with XRE-family HTH domain
VTVGPRRNTEQQTRSAFWDDLAEDLKDPEFLRTYVVESIRVATVDRIMNQLDAARESAGLSKAALARAIGSNPDAIRRLLTAGNVNPTLGTLAEIAAVFGMRIALEPLSEDDKANVSVPLLQGEHPDPAALAAYLVKIRQGDSAGSLCA